MTNDNDDKPAETTTATKQQLQDADNEELNGMISELIHELNSRPGSNADETGNTIHRLLKWARDIQGEHNGLTTKSEAFRIAIDRNNEAVIAEAAKADSVQK